MAIDPTIIIIIMGRDLLCILKVSIGVIYSMKAYNKAEMSNKLAATLKNVMLFSYVRMYIRWGKVTLHVDLP